MIEGDKNDTVEYRGLPVNGRCIRGYGLPGYKSMAPAALVKERVAEVARAMPIYLFEKIGKGIDIIPKRVYNIKCGKEKN